MQVRKFKYGEKVSVRNSELENWKNGWFIGLSPIATEYPYIVITDDSILEWKRCCSFKYIKPLQEHYEVDEKVLVRDKDSETWKRKYFSHFNEHGLPCCYRDGQTKWSNRTNSTDGFFTEVWNQIKKYKESEKKTADNKHEFDWFVDAFIDAYKRNRFGLRDLLSNK